MGSSVKVPNQPEIEVPEGVENHKWRVVETDDDTRYSMYVTGDLSYVFAVTEMRRLLGLRKPGKTITVLRSDCRLNARDL